MRVKELIEDLKQYDEDWIVNIGIQCLQVHPSDNFYPEYVIEIGHEFVEEPEEMHVKFLRFLHKKHEENESVGSHLISNKE